MVVNSEKDLFLSRIIHTSQYNCSEGISRVKRANIIDMQYEGNNIVVTLARIIYGTI